MKTTSIHYRNIETGKYSAYLVIEPTTLEDEFFQQTGGVPAHAVHIIKLATGKCEHSYRQWGNPEMQHLHKYLTHLANTNALADEREVTNHEVDQFIESNTPKARRVGLLPTLSPIRRGSGL